jgi:anti-anti-sigma regulatory factor
VHECTLAGTNLVEEPFQREGQGSAFVSRPNELVVIVVTAGGMPSIQAKITQLVEKGFHSIVVSFAGVKTLEQNALKLLIKARAYVENWAGFLRLCDVGPELLSLVRTLGLEKDLAPQGTRDDAVAAWKRELAGGPPATPTPAADGDGKRDGELKVEWSSPGGTTLDLEMEMPKPSSTAASGLPNVDVAELVVAAEELPKLRRQIESILSRGKRYVTMRLSFKKRMRSEDVQLLTEARDLLTQSGGQLVLASLQQDVATWLKLLDYDREFVITEDADQAELAHRKHASGAKPAPAPSRKATAPLPAATATSIPVPAAAPGRFSVIARGDGSVVVRSPGAGPGGTRVKAPVVLVELDRAAIGSLIAEVERLSSSGVRDIIIDTKPCDPPKGERFDAFGDAAMLAQMKGVRLSFARVSRELRSFLRLLGLEGKVTLLDDLDQACIKHAEQLHAQQRFDELELTFTRKKLAAEASVLVVPESSEDLVASTESAASGDALRSADAVQSADELEEVTKAEAELRFELQKVKNELDRQRKMGADSAAKIRDLESNLQQARSQVRVEQKIVEKVVEKIVERPVEKIKIVEKRVEVPKTDTEELKKAAAEAKRLEDETKRLETELGSSRSQLKAIDEELEKTREKLEFVEARYREADYARNELDKIARSSDDARKRFQGDVESFEAKIKSAEARAKQIEAEMSAQAKAFTTTIKDLEQHLAETKNKAAAAGSSSPGADEKVARLEREKAEILLESKREIERLTREQETLREELESAGEMIERLGKELELT